MLTLGQNFQVRVLWICIAAGFLSQTAGAEPTVFLGFPKGFKWCAATAAHQIEGNNVNSDWWAWEQVPGVIKNGERSGLATNHWNRVASDTALLKGLGVNTYRLSVEWARIEPREGVTNFKALGHYEREIRLLRDAGIEPMVTLSHFTLPAWLSKEGGWISPRAPELFERFARLVYQRLGRGAVDWVTLNEPVVLAVAGYFQGVFPPGKKDFSLLRVVLSNMLRAHARAYQALHEVADKNHQMVRVGIAHHLRVFEGLRAWNPGDYLAAQFLDRNFNWALLRALESGRFEIGQFPWVEKFTGSSEDIEGLAHTQDFIGVNYYSRDRVQVIGEVPYIQLSTTPGAETTDMNWEIYPEGMYKILKQVSNFNERILPIIITENGISDAKDEKRRWFLQRHLHALSRAIEEGVPVEGYCYWSWLDNFEWAEGYGPRFGLYEVNYQTLNRTLRPSARFFSELIRENGFWWDTQWSYPQ